MDAKTQPTVDVTNTDSRPSKLLDIECLRAVAIIFTVVAHYRYAYAQTPGWVGRLDSHAHFWSGVDLFFVISGFVISKNLIPDFAASAAAEFPGRVKLLLRFWLRRVYRLWPSSWLWAVLSLGVVAVFYREQFQNNFYDALAAMLQVYNFHAYACANGAPTCSHLVLGVYWSLSLEEQFYIVLPLVFFFFPRRARWVVGALFAAGVAMSVVWPAPLAFFRFEGFCLGVFIAWAYANPQLHALIEQHLVAPLRGLTVVITVVMLVGLAFIAHGAITNLAYPMLAVCSGVLVMLASFEKNYLGIPRLLKAPMVYLGARSYSIYLVHVPIFMAVARGSDHFPLFEGAEGAQKVLAHGLWLAIATGAVLLFSELNFRLVESRFRRLGHQAPAGPSP